MSIDRWALRADVAHLNHGSFGGCMRSTLETATEIRARVEASPMRFYVLDWQAELDVARAKIAAFLGADAETLVPVQGATHGTAVALRAAHAMGLAAGDEIVTTRDVYRAAGNQLARLADAIGAHIISVPVPTPFDPDALVAAVTSAITPRTKLALFDHITSATALVFPLLRMLAPYAARGIPVIVDGAHAPGQIELSVSAVLAAGATWYTGNHHKWMCGPKASGFLAIAPNAVAHTLPLVTSHGATASYGPPNRLHAEHDWAGTNDPSALLSVPTAIDDVAAAGGGWPAVRARNHALALAMRERLGGRQLAPEEAIGCMVTAPIELPAGVSPLAMEKRLLMAGWEVPVVDRATGPLLRVCAHVYNHIEQIDDLRRALADHGVSISTRQ
ncbi:MAG TPA: aminotransferase class V-fold PLP-dependent enzyme [Kofleriaceae bacterium]|jgi:isopenicillin-N epimerase